MENLSVKELKQILRDAGMPIPSGIEKSELVALAQQAKARKPAFPHFCKEQGSPLSSCKAVFLLFHGYGADEHQFDFFIRNHPEVAFISPKALDSGWWPLDIPSWAMAMNQPSLLAQKIKECPPGLQDVRHRFLHFCREVKSQIPPTAQFLIGGFSQGGTMAIDLALHVLNQEPDLSLHLAVFSGFPVDVVTWEEQAKSARKLKSCLITHGRADPICPFLGANVVVDMLKRNQQPVEFLPHSGGHDLGDAETLRQIQRYFEKVVMM